MTTPADKRDSRHDEDAGEEVGAFVRDDRRGWGADRYLLAAVLALLGPGGIFGVATLKGGISDLAGDVKSLRSDLARIEKRQDADLSRIEKRQDEADERHRKLEAALAEARVALAELKARREQPK